ncbi:hypothetical protein F5Y18DRAFT_432932 [Xylariaceae sp. FL1019]|nr:hypothetical protein F5Y18DRAFT_432932 [Xylariaceae sp. FL1019]
MKANAVTLASWLLATNRGVSSQDHSPGAVSIEDGNSNITRTGTIGDNDTVVSFKGSDLRDIELQISKTNPDSSSPEPPDPSIQILDDPTNDTMKELLCYVPWHFDYASVFHIKQGIEYLRGKSGCKNSFVLVQIPEKTGEFWNITIRFRP